MFFIASKVLWFLAAPLNLLLIAAFAGAFLAAGRPARRARRIALLAILLLMLIGILPLGIWLLKPLEDRFPGPPWRRLMALSCSAARSTRNWGARAIR
jgi:hypothetical protein